MKRALSFFCAICLLVSCFTVLPLKAEATSVSQSSAVAWAKNQIGKGLDYDGVYGNQCVDLIYYYYSYLGVSPVGGNANAYISNSLPSGWERISSNIAPQAGDIAVWKTNYPGWTGDYGHVSIVVSGNSGAFSTIHQNYAGRAYCSQTDNLSTDLLSCVIRPNFSGSSSIGVSLSWTDYPEKHSIGTTNAVLAGWVNMNIDNRAITECGIYLYDYKESLLKSKTETPNHSGYTHFYLWYDVNGELGYTLSPGTPYKYKFMLVINGKTYYSPLYTFTTGDPHSHKYNSGTVTKQPTCTSTGTKTYTCTTCGSTKTESIAKMAHSYNAVRYHYATCTSQGYTEYRCSCGHSYTSNYKNAIGHSYNNATCTSPQKCKTCGATSGSANGHNYAAATCTTPKKCKICGVTSGKATGHNYSKGKCSVCGEVDPNTKTAKIATQPKSVAVKSGKKATVTVKATGDGLKYQWYYAKKGSSSYKKISGATKATYSVKMTSSVNGRKVYCVVKDKYGITVKTNVVTLSLKKPVKITAQPKSTTTTAGKTVKTTVKATGDGLEYQWYYLLKGSSSYKKSSIKKATHSVKMTSAQDGCKLYCVITDKYGNKVKTNVVTLSLKKTVKITTQPKSVATAKNKTAKVTVKATGDGLKYTWYYANKGATKWKKSSVTKATYSAKMTSSVNGRRAYCVVKDKYGNSVKSNVVTLSMVSPLKITTQPKNITTTAGKTVKLTVKASGDGLKFTWVAGSPNSEWFDVSDRYVVNSGKTSTFTFEAESHQDGYAFMCVVRDKHGKEVKSKIVTLTLKKAVKITQQPASISVANGKTAKVTVKATGEGLKYTWYYANKGATKWKKSSVTSAAYSVKMTSSINGRRVYCIIKDKYGNSVKSDVATLSMANNIGKVADLWRCVYGVETNGWVETMYEGAYPLSIEPDGTGDIFVSFSEPEMKFYFKVEFVKQSSNKYYYRLKETKNNGFYLDDDGMMDAVYDSAKDIIEIKFDDGFKLYFERDDWD